MFTTWYTNSNSKNLFIFNITNWRNTILLILAILFSLTSIAQKDTVNTKNDSINAAIVQDFNKKLNLIEIQRISDSLKKKTLEEEIKKLKTTDNLKKASLQKQLLAINKQDSIRIAEKKSQIDSLRKTVKGHAVNGFFNDTLFTIYNKLGSFSAKDRANAISERLNTIADEFGFKANSIKIVESETTSDIVKGEHIIMSISENDAIWNNTSKTALAQAYKNIITNAILKYKNETSLSTLAKEIGQALLVLFIIFFIIKYIKKGFNWLESKIINEENKRIIGIKIRNFTLFDAHQQVKALLTINNFIKWLL